MIKPHLRKRPWLPDKAIEFIENILTPNSIVAETGAGSSTVFMARLCLRVISFEHKKEWFDFLKERIESLGIENTDLRYDTQYPAEGITDPGPFDFVSTNRMSNLAFGLLHRTQKSIAEPSFTNSERSLAGSKRNEIALY